KNSERRLKSRSSPGSTRSTRAGRMKKSSHPTSRTSSGRTPSARYAKRRQSAGAKSIARWAAHQGWMWTRWKKSSATTKRPPPHLRPLRPRRKRRVNKAEDARWLAAAASLAERARPLSRPNPAVGAIVMKDGIVVGQGWTRLGGRPHAEAVALAQAGAAARGATLYVTLEPCAHRGGRGPACADLAAEAGLARVVTGIEDPDPRTRGTGLARLRKAGIDAICAN